MHALKGKEQAVKAKAAAQSTVARHAAERLPERFTTDVTPAASEMLKAADGMW